MPPHNKRNFAWLPLKLSQLVHTRWVMVMGGDPGPCGHVWASRCAHTAWCKHVTPIILSRHQVLLGLFG